MPTRQDKAITVHPLRCFRIETQELIPKGVNGGSECHRCTRMATIGLLNSIHRKSSDRVNSELFDARGGCRHEAEYLGHPGVKLRLQRCEPRLCFFATRTGH